MNESYIGTPLDKGVTSAHFAKRTKEVDGSDLLADPLNLSEKLPLMPYFNSDKFGHKLEEFFNLREAFWKEFVDPYDALLLPGGSGPMVDMVNN